MSDQYDLTIDVPPRINDESVLNEILYHMECNKGSDLFVMGGEHIWMTHYSKKAKVTKRRISDKEVISIIQSIYGSNAPSKLGTGEPIDTSHEFRRSNDDDDILERHRFRVNAVSCLRSGRQSVTITLRSIPTMPPSITDLNVEQDVVDTCRSADQGLILVAGATGQGKSTLLASIIRDQLEDPNGHRNIVTIESPIEFVYDDIIKPSSFINQMEVGRHIQSFHRGVENTLRMAPTTILVGEMRDQETTSAAVEASITGHVVFSTLHANSVAEIFQRLVSLYPKELQPQAKYSLVQSSRLLIAQRLIPTVDGRRTPIREYLPLDQAVKDELLSAVNVTTTAFKLVEKRGHSMMVDIEEKYLQGIISKETYDRQKLNYNTESGGV